MFGIASSNLVWGEEFRLPFFIAPAFLRNPRNIPYLRFTGEETGSINQCLAGCYRILKTRSAPQIWVLHFCGSYLQWVLSDWWPIIRVIEIQLICFQSHKLVWTKEIIIQTFLHPFILHSWENRLSILVELACMVADGSGNDVHCGGRHAGALQRSTCGAHSLLRLPQRQRSCACKWPLLHGSERAHAHSRMPLLRCQHCPGLRHEGDSRTP